MNLDLIADALLAIGPTINDQQISRVQTDVKQPKFILDKLQAVVRERIISNCQRERMEDDIRRHVIQNSVHIKSGNFKALSPQDLGILFHAVDESFFDGLVSSACELGSAKPLAFRLSSRMTSSGGMTTMYKRRGRSANAEFEIAIATTPLFQTFRFDSSANVGGLQCNDRLQAMQRIMEHEIVHLIEMLIWGDSSCSKAPFREIASRFFGHRESNHQLLSPRDVAVRKLGISPGDRVSFTSKGKKLTGFVNRISKRATVLVNSPAGPEYNDGKRYQKFYVPLNRLKRA